MYCQKCDGFILESGQDFQFTDTICYCHEAIQQQYDRPNYINDILDRLDAIENILRNQNGTK